MESGGQARYRRLGRTEPRSRALGSFRFPFALVLRRGLVSHIALARYQLFSPPPAFGLSANELTSEQLPSTFNSTYARIEQEPTAHLRWQPEGRLRRPKGRQLVPSGVLGKARRLRRRHKRRRRLESASHPWIGFESSSTTMVVPDASRAATISSKSLRTVLSSIEISQRTACRACLFSWSGDGL